MRARSRSIGTPVMLTPGVPTAPTTPPVAPVAPVAPAPAPTPAPAPAPGMRRTTFWLLIALGVTVVGAILFTKRKAVMSLFGKAVTAGRELAFKLSLTKSAQPYADLILRVAREEDVDPYLIFAIGDQESGWGSALTPPGPGGTGDWTPRSWGPSPMPPDGKGWGRGLMQLDYVNSLKVNWQDPEANVRAGVKILKGNLAFFTGKAAVPGYTDGKVVSIRNSAAKLGVAPGDYPDPRPLSGKALWEAAIAAYNTGAGNVLLSLAAGKPAQTTTAHGAYVSRVTTAGEQAAARLV